MLTAGARGRKRTPRGTYGERIEHRGCCLSNQTNIEWTDATWNPITGCDRVSAGCDHCYALTLAKRLKAMGNPRYQRDGNPTTSGPGFGVTLHPDKLGDPLGWRKPRRVFVNSMSDLFHAEVPDLFIAQVFVVMAACPQHTFQILTKRPQRMFRVINRLTPDLMVVAMLSLPAKTREQAMNVLWTDRMSDPVLPSLPLPNVWLGVSVEAQITAYRLDWLIKTPAAVRFLSCEPLLGPIRLDRWLRIQQVSLAYQAYGQSVAYGSWEPGGCLPDEPSPIGWIITGGESGRGHRPCEVAWVRDIRDQCAAAGVPFFFKQWGGVTPKAGGRLLDGRVWNEFPSRANVEREVVNFSPDCLCPDRARQMPLMGGMK